MKIKKGKIVNLCQPKFKCKSCLDFLEASKRGYPVNEIHSCNCNVPENKNLTQNPSDNAQGITTNFLKNLT